MAYKSFDEYYKSLKPETDHEPYYYGDFDNELRPYLVNQEYSTGRNDAFNMLTQKYKLSPNQANDVLDAFMTKASHYRDSNNPRNLKNVYVGRFENGVDYNEALNNAKMLRKNNPSAYGIVYGLHFTGDPNPEKRGLKKPFPVSEQELKDITNSLKYGNRANDWQIETYFNKE